MDTSFLAWSAPSVAVTGIAVMTAAEVPNFLAGLLPSGMTIRRFAAKPEDRATLRGDMVYGSALALAVAVGSAMFVHHPLPLIAAAVMLVALLYRYESRIRTPHADAKTIDDQAAA